MHTLANQLFDDVVKIPHTIQLPITHRIEQTLPGIRPLQHHSRVRGLDRIHLTAAMRPLTI